MSEEISLSEEDRLLDEDPMPSLLHKDTYTAGLIQAVLKYKNKLARIPNEF